MIKIKINDHSDIPIPRGEVIVISLNDDVLPYGIKIQLEDLDGKLYLNRRLKIPYNKIDEVIDAINRLKKLKIMK